MTDHVIITGADGCVGTALMKLLKEHDVRTTAMVHAADQADLFTLFNAEIDVFQQRNAVVRFRYLFQTHQAHRSTLSSIRAEPSATHSKT